MGKFIKWLRKPLIDKAKSTSPMVIVICATVLLIARNIPLSKNTIGLEDLGEWAKTVAVLIFVCWISSRISVKLGKKEKDSRGLFRKVYNWAMTPLIKERPQSIPLLIFAFAPGYIIYRNWPLNENIIEISEIIVAFSVSISILVFLIAMNWYNKNRNQ